MTGMLEQGVTWQESDQTRTVAMNIGARYLILATELLLGLVMLPFNMKYLGPSEYGLWMLAASIVTYFPVLDLGYGSAVERFVARYRAERNVRAINELASTATFIFAGIAVLALCVVAGIAVNIGRWFNLDAVRARTGAIVMFLVGVQFAAVFACTAFGAIVNAFQRQYVNARVGLAVSVSVAVVNVSVLLAGGGLVELVTATTLTRLAGQFTYRLNAYRVFPPLRIRPSLFRLGRVRELTGFSVYMLVQDLAGRANYAADPIIIAAILSTGVVAVWTVAQRLADIVQQLTNNLNMVIFPFVVDCDSRQRTDRLRDLLVQGTRLSLATTLPVGGSLAILAEPVVVGWTGPAFRPAAIVLQILAAVVVVRVGSATAGTLLQGAGYHRLVASSNLVAALANIGLSIVLIRTYGLPGLAVATLIPVTIRAATVLLPAACTRVGIPFSQFVASAIWPAAWPAIVALGLLAPLRSFGDSLGHAIVLGALTGVLYVTLFVGLAVGRDDRNRYIEKLRSVARRPALNAA